MHKTSSVVFTLRIFHYVCTAFSCSRWITTEMTSLVYIEVHPKIQHLPPGRDSDSIMIILDEDDNSSRNAIDNIDREWRRKQTCEQNEDRHVRNVRIEKHSEALASHYILDIPHPHRFAGHSFHFSFCLHVSFLHPCSIYVVNCISRLIFVVKYYRIGFQELL